ncbi:MAG: hypothetical protein H0X30_02845 [Anaerolineae bacterium]|nr:hypothetical protein [Anaerolineae bacterium]
MGKLHEQATIVDLHAHPILKAIFRRTLSRRVMIPSPFVGDLNPLDVQTTFPKLGIGKVDVLFSTAYALEKQLLDEFIKFETKWTYIRFL